jgi:hypothetical protein
MPMPDDLHTGSARKGDGEGFSERRLLVREWGGCFGSPLRSLTFTTPMECKYGGFLSGEPVSLDERVGGI